MITAISTIKTTIKTHITITRLATRGALLALFAGLFILAACGGGGVKVDVSVETPGCTDPFAKGCLAAGATLRANAITACRLLIEGNKACANTIPEAVLACLTDPYSCDEGAYNTAIRTTSATVEIGALQTGRTDSCRGRTVAGARLCNGAIDNTCQPFSTTAGESRNQLVLDNLCNNAPNYLDARNDFVADCTDGDRLNNAGCTSRITTCTNSPFSAECGVDVYDSYRAVACRNALEGTANARCRSENIIATYCGANAFVTTAGCLADEDFDDARIADCIIGDNVRQPRCKNETTFSTSGLIACFENPYGDGCDTALGSSFNSAQNNRENYCTRLGARAGGNPLCDAAILNVCTGDDANIFNALCFAENYQTARVMACSATDSQDGRCTATVAQICTDNPFTQTVGGTAGNLCTDANARVAFVARCASGNQTVCGAVSVGAVTLKNCIDNPYNAGCGDDAFNDLKAARYDHCTSDTASLECAGVESLVCISDSEKTNPLANPFLAVCRNSNTPYAGIQTAFCMARTGDNIPECVESFRDDCNDDPFTTACLASTSYASDRAVIIFNCLANSTVNAADCERIVTGTTTVADCVANPFDAANGCSTNTGFDATRVARTALCSATGTPFDTLCEDFPGKDSARTAHCTNDETFFNALCLDEAYPNTRALRASFCSQPANRFLVKCTNVAGVSDARATLVLLCSANPEAAGCDQPANGISGATLAQCGADPSNTANGCNELVSFQPVRDSRTALCQTRGEGHSPYDPLCDNFNDIDDARETYCTSTNADDGGSFDANCVLDYPDGTALARRAFAESCRGSSAPAACATTFVVKGVSVADCIENPYKRECSGTEAMPNPDFAAEVNARNELCRDGGDIYNDLCLLNGVEIVAGVEAARIAGCTTPALAAFNDACTEEAYVGTEAAQRGYCSTRDILSPDDRRICGDYEVSICGAGADANPFALLCTEGGRDNSENQVTFCGLPQNLAGAAARTPQCTNDATLICPIDPFNETAGIDGMVNCLMDDGAYVNNRADRCAAGTQGTDTSVCNILSIVTRVCTDTGRRANPFAEFCKTADGVPGDLNTVKTAFANACAGRSPSVHCETPDVKTALCSGSGEFIRPFADTCTGEVDIGETRVSFCGTGNNVTAEPRCNAIIVSVCRDDPFSSGCETSAPDDVAKLRDLRAEHCESLTVADALCSAEAVTAVCEGYTAASGLVVINPLSGLCAGGYATERRDACLNIASEASKNAVCDTISEVEEACRPTPFNTTTPGCAFILQADDLQEAYCVAEETTWQDACDTLAEASGGENTVDIARRDSCLDLDSDRRSPEDCKALESVGDACEANPFEKRGCNVFEGPTLIGYELGYCSLTATAWEAGCNDLVDTQSAVALARTQACTLEAVVPTNAGSRCNDVEAVKILCESTPLAPNFLGCKFLDKFEEYASNYCEAIGTTWTEVCNPRALDNEGVNDVVTARRDACLASADVPAFPDPTCAEITINYCGDTDNSANALDMGCSLAVFPSDGTTLEKQRQKACAEGGANASSFCTDQAFALAYCTNTDPFAGLGCDELSTISTIRSSYCTTNSGVEECDIPTACMTNPFDGRCVDESSSTTYADARKARANACVLSSPTVDCARVDACNARPFSTAITAHIPTTGTATTCGSDLAFADIRATFITKCIVINAVQDVQDCKNAVADGVSCLADPYVGDVFCESATQLGSAPNVATAKASYCRTTTGSNSFTPNCANSGEFPEEVKEAQVASCLHSDSADLGSCPTLIAGFCTDTTGGAAATAFDARCDASRGNHRTGTATARATLCVNGTEHEDCPTIGPSFTTWADTTGTDTVILDAGAGTTDNNANFIRGVLNADGKLHLGKNPLDVDIIAETYTVRLNHDYTGDEASATPLSGDAEDGFVYATADVAADGVSRFFVGILHTTDLGAPITDTTGKALWKGVIQAFRYDGTSAYTHNADFVLEVNFATPAIDFHVNTGGVITNVVTLLGQDGVSFSITSGTFNRTTGLITGTVLLADNASGSTKETTALLRGVIGEDGAVGVFASESPNTGDFGDFVGGFVASSADDVPVCPIETNPFGRGCNRDVPAVLTAQRLACTTGVLPNNNRVTAINCNHADLSGLICNDDITINSIADPFAQICASDDITIFGQGVTDAAAAREIIRAHCLIGANSNNKVCLAQEVQLVPLRGMCVVGDAPTLFGAICASYTEFVPERAEVCRKRDALSTLTCDTAEIIALVCTAAGVAANPFDTICSPTTGTYAGARTTFAARCAVQRANDSRGQRVLKGADCSDSGLNSDCLDHPFTTVGGCNADVDYDTVRSDRISICRDLSDINLFDYICFGAIENVCGLTSAPTDAVLFKDSLCVNETDYDTRRAAIVEDCGLDKADTNAECVVEAATGINIISCIDNPYQVECAAAAFGDRRTAVLGECNIANFVSMSTAGVNCRDVQDSVCGAGIYAGDPFDAFCDKKDTANNNATIAPATLADGRNKHCQIGTNATSVQECAEFLNRPTTAALLVANELGESPNTTGARNQFLRGTADGLNTGGFIRKSGQFAFVSTLNLNTATYGTSALGGDAADGVAYFAGREHITQGDITTDVNYYAGIHSGTDLGNPLPRQYGAAGEDVTVRWNGRIGWLIYDENSADDGYAFDNSTGSNGVTDFTLTINLTQRSVYAHIVRLAALSGARGFLLEGVYDKNGVIEGTAKYGPNGGNDLSSALYEGLLIGLIGEQGAVGAFHLTEIGAGAVGGASGGFVASPSAAGSDPIVLKKGTFNYWIAERVARGGKQIDVLETAEEINKDNPDVNFIVAGGSTGQIGATGEFRLQKFSSGSSDGLGFGFADYSGVEKFYVGLLPSTDLGAPRTDSAGPPVFWNGLLSIAKQDEQETDTGAYLIETGFTLTITFTGNGRGTITTSDEDGSRILLPRSIFDTAGLKDEFAIDGNFDEFGLIRGRVRYYSKQLGGNRRVHDGILTGLIGAEGLAGIFTSEASGTNLATVGHYVGGFVASRSLGLGGADTWADNAVKADGTTPLEVKAARDAVQGDDEYTFIRGTDGTFDLGSQATRSDELTQYLTFDTDLILDNGDVFSLNSSLETLGGISFAQADVGTGTPETQFYAGLLPNTFVGTPLTADANVDWRGVISLIAGDTPTLYTTNFRLAINFSTKTVFSTTDFLQTLSGVIHNIELSGKFSDQGVIYGTATYQVGDDSNEGALTGLIGQDGAVAVFGGGDTTHDAGRFVGGIVAVPGLITSVLIPHSTFVWAAEIDEAVFENTRFDKSVASTSPDDNTITLRAKNAAGIFEETVITDTDAINLDTTVLGGRNNPDRTEDGFVVFKAPSSDIRRVGIVAGTNLGGPVVDTGGTGKWHARMAGFVISSDEVIEFETNFTLNVDFDLETLGIGTETPSFQVTDAGSTATFNFSFANIGWNPSTGFFTGLITLGTTVDATTTEGVLRGIIGADGAVATLKVSAEAGSSTRTFIGGFVAVPEAIGATRGQPSYWAEYARNADNTAGLDVRGIRGAKAGAEATGGDGAHTFIEGGLETLELGLEVAKHATNSVDLTFKNTEEFPDKSTFSLDSTVAGGISVATDTTGLDGAGVKYYAGLLSSTDVGRLLSRTTPAATWVGRLAVIISGGKSYTPDFELAIDFNDRTLTSFNPDDSNDRIFLFTNNTTPVTLVIDGEFNDRGVIYGTTAYQVGAGASPLSWAGVLTGLIGQKGAAAVFYSSTSVKYAGGFIAVPNRGDLTQVYDNIPASYNEWVTGIDATPLKDTSSGSALASVANTAAFTTEVPAEAGQTKPFSLNLAPFGGDVGDGFIGYGTASARHIGLLSSISLGGLNLHVSTTTVTWAGVLQLIIGNGDILTENFTLNVAFGDSTIGLAGDFAFMDNATAYDLTFAQLGWDENSGLITGTVNIIPTATPGNASVGDVRGLIGQDGLVAAFRSTAASYSSFTGGFVAAEAKKTKTTFTDYFSSEDGGDLLKATADDGANGGTAKFSQTSGIVLPVDGGGTAGAGVYRLGASVLNTGTNPNGFVLSTSAQNFAVGLLNTTDLGAPLPLIYAGAAVEWTGTLYNSLVSGSTAITLVLNFAEGTIKTKTPSTDVVRIDGYFGLNPLALAANLPLGFLGGMAVYHSTNPSLETELPLIGQIGQTGVVGIFRGAVTTQVVGGFVAFSSDTTANAREFNIKQTINTTLGIIGINQVGQGHAFRYANADGNIKDADALTIYRFGLGGVDTPATNPNGFTLAWSGQGFAAAAGIWANTNLGLLLPGAEPTAIWTGTIHALKVTEFPGRRLVGAPISSAFTIQVDFANSKISTVASIDDDVATLGAIDLTGGDTIAFTNAAFDNNGIIGCSNPCSVAYTVSGVTDQTFGLGLAGLIGPKGAIGLFRGTFSNSNNVGEKRDAPGIIGGFQVTPTARAIKVAPPPRVVVIPPKQLNYKAYLAYYQTDFTFGPGSHGPGVLIAPNDDLSQFAPSEGDGSGLATGVLGFEDTMNLNFAPFTVYLNGEDKSTPNGFVLVAGTSVVDTTLRTRSYAGLLAGADVGRFTDDLTATVLWSGSFYSSAYTAGTSAGNRAPVRFPITLTVDFGAGTIGTNGVDVELLNGHSINIAGTFGFAQTDANQGIIGGDITYTAPNTDAQKLRTTAPLYGIIGDAGALAVFAGGLYPDVQGAGSNISPLVGGFEVSPNPVPTVHYQVFLDYFSGLGSGDGRRVYDTITQFNPNPPKSHFIKGTRTGLVLTGLETAKPLSGGTVRLGGDERSNSGFALLQHFTTDRPRGHTYAALLTGTNLGAVLPVRFASGNTTAIWHGSFYTTNETNVGEKITVTDATAGILGRGNLVHTPLSLTLDLAAGTLRTVNLLGNLGAVALSATESVEIDARFGLNPLTAKLPYGILLGTVRYNKENYELAGLIGVDGAIGIFRRNVGFSTIGGFEVTPPPPPAYGRAEYAVFEDFYTKRPEADDRYLESSRTANTSQFVRGLLISLVAPADGDLITGFAPLTVYLGGDVNSGNAFVIENFNDTHVVGLLGTTDLGFAPHETVVSATWDGTFYVSNNVTGTDTSAPEGFLIKDGVKVNFGAGTITSSQATYELANNQFISFGIFGEFGRIHELPLGILGGFVKYGHHETDASLIMAADLRELPLIGVIGRQGALGVFRDPSDNNLVGGFEAGYNASYRVWLADIGAVGGLSSGFDPNLSPTTCCDNAIQKTAFLKANDAGTGLISDVDIASYAGTTYRLGDVATNPNGFILAGGTITTVPASTSSVTAGTPRVAGAGLLPTINLGPVISDVVGSASWGGKAYVIDTVSTTTKVFNLTFNLNFATGVFSTGANAVAEANGGGQTLKIEGIFGQGLAERPRGVLDSRGSDTNRIVTYFDNDVKSTAITTAKLTGLIGRDGLVGIFTGGGNSIFQGFVGGFWASPSTTATTVNHDAFVTHYDADITDLDDINFLDTPGTALRFANTSPLDTDTTGLQSKSFFELGEGTSDETVTDGLFAYVYNNVKVIGITTTTDLGAVQPITTPSATWLGRVFVKSDATAFSTNNNQRQVGLKVNFAEGTIDTVQPASFTIGAETHSLSVRGRFGLHSFARGSDVPSASGLLSGFVTYTHHGQKAANFELIGLIGAEGALGAFKGTVVDNGAELGVIGGFEASPDTATYLPKYATYIEQFKGYINLNPIGFKSQIAQASADALHLGGGSAIPQIGRATYRLGGANDADTANKDGFAISLFNDNIKAVGILSGTDLGMPVNNTDLTAIWAGRLYTSRDGILGDVSRSNALDLQVNFTAGTIKTLQPITIVAYTAVDGGTPSVRKQTLEIEGRFGSHLDALGLRTGILGGSVIYNVGHLAPRDSATGEYERHSITIAHLPLLGLIGEDGAIGVFQGAVSDVNVVGGFEVSPRVEITTTTASFERWARGASECGAINLGRNSINLKTECPLGAHTPIVFAHPNDLFESDDDFIDGRPVSKGFVLGSDKATGIDFFNALSPIPADVAVSVLTLGGDNFADGSFVADDTFFTTTGERFTINTPQGMDEDGSDDGIAFVTHYSPGTTFYAGLLSTTDLGAPLTMSSGSTIRANWPGRFIVKWFDAIYETNDFVLDIDFTNSTISTAGVSAATLDWTLQGHYDANGIITGIIKNTAANVTRIGTLTGLIGAQGAVGTFFIDEKATNGQNISYVGGFVAAPVGTTRATGYAHFSDHYTAQLNADLAAGDRAGFASSLADGSGLDTTTETGSTFAATGAREFNEVFRLGGVQAGTNGFTLLRGTLTIAEPASTPIRYRAGLLSGADVGPLVSAEVNGLWTGTGIVAYSLNTSDKYLEFDLILNVNFTVGTIISAGESINDQYGSGNDGEYLRIAGRFGAGGGGTKLPPGILDGMAFHRDGGISSQDISEMPLIGLIGGDGAIGVFYGQGGSSAIAGGFTARPFALTDAGKAATPTAVDVDVLPDYPTTTTTQSGGFLKFGDTLTAANLPAFPPTPTSGVDYQLSNTGIQVIRNDIEEIGGVAYYSIKGGSSATNFLYYAGILADTNLGMPRTETAGTAIWTGKFLEHFTVQGTGLDDKDKFVKFHVDFEEKTLQVHNGLTGMASDGGGTLTFSTASGAISYTINAVFGNGFADANNNIITTGQLGGQITRSFGGASKTAAISGLIGEKGVVASFVDPEPGSNFAGGFWAVPVLKPAVDLMPFRVTFSDWADDFGRATPPPAIIPGTTESRFLTGKATVSVIDGPNEVELDGSGLNEPTIDITPCCANNGGSARFALTFGKDGATYGGEQLGGGGTAADGVAGFAAGSGNTYRAIFRYVGFLSGTDLGAPISAGTPVGKWYGRFVGIRRTDGGFFPYRTLTDFVLTVGYTEGGGGTLTMANIDDSNTSSQDYYTMVGGKFDGTGVISGALNYQRRNNSGENRLLTRGILTGLIGVDGAVGGFIGGAGTIDAITAHGSDDSRFFGGFVAAPAYVPPPVIPGTPEFWLENALDSDGTGVTIRTAIKEAGDAVVGDPFFGFATGDSDGVDLGVTVPTLAYATRMVGATENGFAFARAQNRSYVGILSTTSLGAAMPFNEIDPTVQWTGLVSVYVSSSIDYRDYSITLDIGFDGTAGTITTQYADGHSLGSEQDKPPNNGTPGPDKIIVIDGKFTNTGVIYGTGSFSHQPLAGTTHVAGFNLSGLIGMDGAVGTFISSNPNVAFVGGFVASPATTTPTQGTAAFWQVNAIDGRVSAKPRSLGIRPAGSADKNIGIGGAFLIVGGGDADALSNFNNPNPPNVVKLTLDDLEGSNDGNSGYSAVRVYDDTAYIYTGLLSTTNVGAPFTNTSQPAAEWTAIAQAAHSESSVTFTLDVAFTGGAGTITTKQGGVNYGTNQNLIIDGKFGTNGVIYGTATIADTPEFVFGPLALTGLIGEGGAVGVFAGRTDSTSPPFGGGFVAFPKAPPACLATGNCVDYADWAAVKTPVVVNDFVAEHKFTTSTGSTVFTGTLAGSSISVYDTSVGGDFSDGFGYYHTSGYFYVGILESTNLGGPVTSSIAGGAWNGKFTVVESDGSAATVSTHDLTLDVVFGATQLGNAGLVRNMGQNTGMNIGLTEYSFTGEFDSRGVITGTIDHGDKGGGVMQGLIGAEGTVGVFHSTQTGNGAYGGGFIARPSQ